jgi:hypothetical protein
MIFSFFFFMSSVFFTTGTSVSDVPAAVPRPASLIRYSPVLNIEHAVPITSYGIAARHMQLIGHKVLYLLAHFAVPHGGRQDARHEPKYIQKITGTQLDT